MSYSPFPTLPTRFPTFLKGGQVQLTSGVQQNVDHENQAGKYRKYSKCPAWIELVSVNYGVYSGMAKGVR